MSYAQNVIELVKKRDPGQPEFHQAVTEVLESLEPALDRNPNTRRTRSSRGLSSPSVSSCSACPGWTTRARSRSTAASASSSRALSARTRAAFACNPSVNLGILKFLGFEQVLKNSLTTLPMGGAKGGSDFDPRASPTMR